MFSLECKINLLFPKKAFKKPLNYGIKIEVLDCNSFNIKLFSKFKNLN